MRRQSTVVIAAAILSIVATLLLVDSALAVPPGASGYHVVKTIPIGGPGRWDYIVVDSCRPPCVCFAQHARGGAGCGFRRRRRRHSRYFRRSWHRAGARSRPRLY